MKKLLSLAALVGLLASCAPTSTVAPSDSVTGYWKGSLSKYGLVANIAARLTVTDAAGNFTGKGSISGAAVVDNATVSGNVKTGALVATNGTDTVTCEGNFKNNAEYSGTCVYNSFSAPLYMYREGN